MDEVGDQEVSTLTEAVAQCLNVTDTTDSKDSSEDFRVIDANPSEVEVISNSKKEEEPNEDGVCNSSPTDEPNSNSMISSDSKAKETAQLSNNDLVFDSNNKNRLMEENQKLIVENEKYKKLLDRMNKSEVPVGDNSGAIDDVIALKNQNHCLQTEIIKLKEIQDSCLMEMNVLREQLSHAKTTHSEPLVWNREAITGFCDREYLYKLILRYGQNLVTILSMLIFLLFIQSAYLRRSSQSGDILGQQHQEQDGSTFGAVTLFGRHCPQGWKR